jgi:hypothetical protein
MVQLNLPKKENFCNLDPNHWLTDNEPVCKYSKDGIIP